MSGLTATIVVERPAFTLELELEVAAGEIVAILGPNGSGKTTTLRTLAGLVRMTEGSIRLGDKTLDDTATDVHVETRSRDIGVVFQDYLLFPHLSAAENIAFGPIAHGTPAPRALVAAREWLARFDLADFADVRPRQLSGGQAQRVALARALILEPPLLLLDEPLAALDVGTRASVRRALKEVLGAYGGSTVLVTHDPADALALADQMVVLEAGTVAQRGAPADVAASPANEYVAGLFAD
ncbi:MAG TPA: ATP-binding cassette domain-containing protein [Galbitalea sp.]|jgi:molybdate transport system ATP-binding protein